MQAFLCCQSARCCSVHSMGADLHAVQGDIPARKGCFLGLILVAVSRPSCLGLESRQKCHALPVNGPSMLQVRMPASLQVDVGISWVSALATLILVPSDIYHAMQVST